jgi:hypothetical protein
MARRFEHYEPHEHGDEDHESDPAERIGSSDSAMKIGSSTDSVGLLLFTAGPEGSGSS